MAEAEATKTAGAAEAAKPSLVDRGLVRQDAYDPRPAQSPSADLRSSTRLVCSQVSSLSLRPK